MNTPKSVWEVNFDCLVGPTHHFGGLSLGNISSTNNKWRRSSPKRAALQGLEKMRFLTKAGFKQCVLPPHKRPHYPSLKRLGFAASTPKDLAFIYERTPELFSSACSSSFMWAANAATVSPKSDSKDHKTHITPANLVTMFHREIEASFSTKVFRKIFYNEDLFTVHDSLPAHDLFSDEGAANHNRLSKSHSVQGLQIFVYGKLGSMFETPTKIYPARQSSLAGLAVARLHALLPDYFMNIAQNPLAIDAGAFHNDVVCVVNEHIMLCHEMAFLHQKQVLGDIKERYQRLYEQEPCIIEISARELPLADAVSSYLFNSQLLTKADGKMLLFAPSECLKNEKARHAIDRIVYEHNPIDEVQYFDISESMANGGGPACLRLRIPLDAEELQGMAQGVILSDELFARLEKIIQTHYRDSLSLPDFFDKEFLESSKYALDEIAQALGLGDIYDF